MSEVFAAVPDRCPDCDDLLNSNVDLVATSSSTSTETGGEDDRVARVTVRCPACGYSDSFVR